MTIEGTLPYINLSADDVVKLELEMNDQHSATAAFDVGNLVALSHISCATHHERRMLHTRFLHLRLMEASFQYCS